MNLSFYLVLTGYVRLRCADIVPGASLRSTYENIYATCPPLNENMLDPFVDLIPIRRLSSSENDCTPPTSPQYNLGARFQKHFFGSNENLSAANSFEQLPQHKTQFLNNQSKKPLERRLSGTSLNMSSNSDKSQQKENRKFQPDQYSELVKRLALIEEEEEDEDEDDGNDSFSNNQEKNGGHGKMEEKEEEKEEEKNAEEKIPSNSNLEKEKVRLSRSIQKECFIDRWINIKKKYDVLDIDIEKQLRTYFSSKRYMEIFMEEFRTLSQVLEKEELFDDYQVQGPAILSKFYFKEVKLHDST